MNPQKRNISHRNTHRIKIQVHIQNMDDVSPTRRKG